MREAQGKEKDVFSQKARNVIDEKVKEIFFILDIYKCHMSIYETVDIEIFKTVWQKCLIKAAFTLLKQQNFLFMNK